MVLLSVIVLLCSVPFMYPLLVKKTIADKIDIDSLTVDLRKRRVTANNKQYVGYADEERSPYDYPSPGYSSYSSKNKGKLFYFDPNSISVEGWKKLGLRDKTIATIMNFRNKGGKFRQPGDIKKIWGLFPDEAERLIPYIKIETTGENISRSNYSNFSPERKYDNRKIYASVNINSADTIDWMALPGIGTALSKRIISFRDKLGGFYDVNQVGETFGLPDSVFQKIKPLLQISGEVKKININTASLEELKAHPYIRYQLGNAIAQYRVQHGNYRSVQDIQKIMIIKDDIFNKISPYLTVE